MIEITIREIAELTPAEQRQMERWIGDRINLAQLRAAQTRRRALRQAIDLSETAEDYIMDQIGPEDDCY